MLADVDMRPSQDGLQPRNPPVALSNARRGYVLFLLMLIMGMAQLDRGIVSILLDSIKADMRLSDTAMGFIVGTGFALVYAVVSIPLARVADRHGRTAVIGFGMILYSTVAMLMGMAHTVVQLVVARAAIAVGEASGSAPSSSLISHYFAPKHRSRAMSIWSAGSYLGLLIGLVAAGWLNQHFGWRVALSATAAPGLVIAIVFLLTVREPEPVTNRASDPLSLAATLRLFASNRTYLLLLGGFVSQAFLLYSLVTWAPALLGRVHHMNRSEVGLYAGLATGLCSLVGTLTGGFVTPLVAGVDLRRMAILPVAGALLMPVATAVFLLADNRGVALAGLFAACFFLPIHLPAGLVMMHAVVPPTLRSVASALIFMLMALGGLALGPLIVGMVSDALAYTGSNSIRYALLAPCCFGLISAIFFMLSSRTIETDNRRVSDAF